MITFGSLFSLFRRNIKGFSGGFFPWRLWGTSPQFNTYADDINKLQAVFSNPALLKVFTLQCDLFSLAKIYVYDKKDRIQDHVALERLANPNYMQDQAQFLWDYMFWKMVGNDYLYMESDILERTNAPMYFMDPAKIEWPTSIEKWKDKLILSERSLNELMGTELQYRYEDGSVLRFPLKKLCMIHDLSNGTGNWFKGYSRIDALYKILTNSEVSLDSKNINTRYTGKFLVAGTADPSDVTKRPMGEKEKLSIEERIDGPKQVHGMKSMIEIKRFVEDLKKLDLDNSFLADYYFIGSMYNIPRDVLEAYKSSTFENQEKARAGHVSYTLEPAAEALAAKLAKRWGLTKGWKIVISWDHLPFTQVFEKERTAIQAQKISAFSAMLRAGIPLEEINAFLDTNFTKAEIYESPKTNTRPNA